MIVVPQSRSRTGPDGAVHEQFELGAQHAERSDHGYLLKGSIGQVELHAPVIGRRATDLREGIA